jgi:hypothetical protein
VCRALALVDDLFARAKRPHLFLELGALFRGDRVAPGNRLLDDGQLVAPLANLLVGFEAQIVGLFLGVEERLFLDRLAFPLRVPQQALGLVSRPPHCFRGEPLAAREPVEERRGRDETRHAEIDEITRHARPCRISPDRAVE